MTNDEIATVAAYLTKLDTPSDVYMAALPIVEHLQAQARLYERNPCRWITQGGGRVLVADPDGRTVTLSGLSRFALYLPEIWAARGAAVRLPLANLSDCPTASRATVNAQRAAIVARLYAHRLRVLYGAVSLIRLEREGPDIVAWANNAPRIEFR